MSDDFRVVIVLRDVVDLDYQEIADLLDLPLGTVKSRIARARSQLADHLRLDALPPLPPTSSTPTLAPEPDDPQDGVLDDLGNPPGVEERPRDADD